MQSYQNDVLILTEQKLLRMQELDKQIKVLDAELQMLKKQVIEEYFVANNSDSYRTSRGLELATYKSQERNVFNQSKFKCDHNDIFSMYSEVKSISVFLLK